MVGGTIVAGKYTEVAPDVYVQTPPKGTQAPPLFLERKTVLGGMAGASRLQGLRQWVIWQKDAAGTDKVGSQRQGFGCFIFLTIMVNFGVADLSHLPP